MGRLRLAVAAPVKYTPWAINPMKTSVGRAIIRALKADRKLRSSSPNAAMKQATEIGTQIPDNMVRTPRCCDGVANVRSELSLPYLPQDRCALPRPIDC